MDRSFLFVLGSSRRDGNTESLARKAAEQLPAEVAQRWIRLADHPLPDYEDRRHDARDHAADDSASQLFEATLGATDLVIASPLYWYSLSSTTKRYLDYWSGWLRSPGVDFKAAMAGRTLWGVTVHSHAHREEEVVAPLAGTLELTAAYMGMRFGGVLVGAGNRPGDVLGDPVGLGRAKTFFAREPVPARFPYEAREAHETREAPAGDGGGPGAAEAAATP
ncbi:flavodoxin family protein [Streptomyces sp. TS71-3]|uniref:flavodoxin family protein n=1 Tax=Streptomyces sp. TS71-3 TaxID=2733862 RepID=UPI001B10D41E|nr:NAD(P)H-dependent oxidoreductase [Streptomyces sp. TS71-3]GHJ34873.1 flavodoxin [Streptomyces sp. TS71-3]